MILTANSLAMETGIPLAMAHKVLQEQTAIALRLRTEPWAWLMLSFPLSGYAFVTAAINEKLLPLVLMLGAGAVWYGIGRALAIKPSRKIAQKIARSKHVGAW
jgi:hypothetical protein